MLLGKAAISDAIERGSMAITPFDSSLLKEASYTFTLGNRAFTLESATAVVDFRSGQASRTPITMDQEGIIISPGAFFLFETHEHLRLSPSIACMLSVRGHLGLSGIDLLGSDYFCEPDTDNPITLGVSNRGPFPVRLYPRMPVVKGLFIKVEQPVS